MDQRDHPTAEQVFMRAKSSMPEISMATVYNTLDTLIKCDLVNEVNLQQTAKRYCPNMSRHGHFFCNSCETVYDIPIVDSEVPAALEMPEGFQLEQTNVSMRGMCPDCNNQK
jgi:Fur family peroxide stress response transcriptional regulator